MHFAVTNSGFLKVAIMTVPNYHLMTFPRNKIPKRPVEEFMDRVLTERRDDNWGKTDSDREKILFGKIFLAREFFFPLRTGIVH